MYSSLVTICTFHESNLILFLIITIASYSTALNVLSDVLGDFVSRLCISLKSNIDGYHRGVTHTQEGELDVSRSL